LRVCEIGGACLSLEAHANLWSMFISLPLSVLVREERLLFLPNRVTLCRDIGACRGARPGFEWNVWVWLMQDFGPSLLSLKEMVDIWLLVAVQVEHPS
jgi:hypothetical protein